jgi:hypothetical protein
LLNNEQVSLSALVDPHRQQTLAAARGAAVTLWVEDTTELDSTAQASQIGLGQIGNGQGQGLLLHSTLAVEPGSRTVLGIGPMQGVWRVSHPKGTQGWRRTPAGQVWSVSAQAIGRPPSEAQWVHVSDRGSDIFEYMAACADLDQHVLRRVAHHRKLIWTDDQPQAEQAEAQKLLTYARDRPEAPDSGFTLDVPASAKQPARQAHWARAWAQVILAPPAQAPADIRPHPPLTVWLVRAWAPDAPPGVEALAWVRLTSLPILTLADAQRLVAGYTCRWLCEDFHQALKTGCRSERSQLDTADALQRLLGLAAPIAVRLLQLRQAARATPQVLATARVDPLRVDVLARQQRTEAQTMTLFDFWRRVARLGGFQGRQGDGFPGWRTVWRGWRDLSDLTQGARLFLNRDTS